MQLSVVMCGAWHDMCQRRCTRSAVGWAIRYAAGRAQVPPLHGKHMDVNARYQVRRIGLSSCWQAELAAEQVHGGLLSYSAAWRLSALLHVRPARQPAWRHG